MLPAPARPPVGPFLKRSTLAPSLFCVLGAAVWTSPLDQGERGYRERARMSAGPSDDSKGQQEWPTDGRENLPFVVSMPRRRPVA